MLHRTVLRSAVVVLCAVTTPSFSGAPYKGHGGQIEAAGVIAGAYMLAATTL